MKPDGSILSVQQVSYQLIRERILDGTFRSGALLKPHIIAKELGISRIPVREALRQLATEGLVTLRQNRTAIVTTLTVSEINELFEMRAALEALTAQAIANHITDAALAELEEFRLHMDEARGDVQEWIRRHAAFHDQLLKLSDRPLLAAEIIRIRTAAQPHQLMYVDIYRRTEMPGHEHKTLLSAISTRNTALIEMCLREHVLSAGRGVVSFLAMHHPQLESREGLVGSKHVAPFARSAQDGVGG